MSGPAVPKHPHRGTRYDPPSVWMFGKGYYGPPDLRPVPGWPSITMDQARAWMNGRIPLDHSRELAETKA